MKLRNKLLLLTFLLMCACILLLSIMFQIQISRGHTIPSNYVYALKWTVGVFVFVTVVLVACVSYLIVRPLQAMQKQAEYIAKGNYHIILPVRGQDEISLLANTLNHLTQQLSKQEELRKNLLQDIAHELRTPLTTLKSHLEAFSDGIWEPSPERLQSCIEEIMRFETLVQSVEILHAADFDSQLPTSELDLRLVVQIVSDMFQLRCAKAGIKLAVSEHPSPVWILANTNHVSQITWNLLDNAVKYTPAGGSVEVVAAYDKSTPILQIADTGIGIPKHEQENIFERFYRVDKSRNRKTGGSGLGLAIVKRLVTTSQATISISSELGHGTKVRVEWKHV